MQSSEIVLPITEPETEWVAGRALQKMSPTYDHGSLQGEFFSALKAWSRGRGSVATEWRFRVEPPGEARRPLVPDVAFVAADRLRGKTREEIQVPAFAPTVAVEILSPGDRQQDVASKIDVYLRSGTLLVIVADPATRTMALHDPLATTLLKRDDVLRHPALPEFELQLGPFFEEALRL